MINRIANILCRYTEIVSMVLFSVLIISVFLAVLDRFLIHQGLFWTEELARFLFVWLGSLTAAIMVQRRGHFAVSFLTEKFLDEHGRQILDIVISVIILALMVLNHLCGVCEVPNEPRPENRNVLCILLNTNRRGTDDFILYCTYH